MIILGGDGNYYLTVSAGRNVWRHNDGIEIYRSKDLKTWSYLGVVWSIDRDHLLTPIVVQTCAIWGYFVHSLASSLQPHVSSRVDLLQ